MPRRRGGGGFGRSSVPATRPAQPAQPAVIQQQPRQPGLFGQMASTAAGVAVGSAVVRFINHNCLIFRSSCYYALSFNN